jgi:GntR family galactonate operon transcriptional repressor
MVATGSPGWFNENLPNHAIAARAITDGNAEKARAAMQQVLGYTQFKLSTKKKYGRNAQISSGEQKPKKKRRVA